MGLDQYLTAKRYFMTKDFKTGQREAPAPAITALLPELKDLKNEDGHPVQVDEVTVRVAYWRKANAIHQWFVQNVQNGVDDCGDYYVSRDDLAKLRDAAEQALAVPANAADVLPTTDGFFFGSTDYDEYYTQDLQYTVKALTALLDNESLTEWDFNYHSSW